jgi:hypothetical protein
MGDAVGFQAATVGGLSSRGCGGWERMDMRDLGRSLILVGVVVAGLGVLLALGPKLPWKIGRLPGDIVIRRDGFSFYLPLMTSILLSLVLTLILALIRRR